MQFENIFEKLVTPNAISYVYYISTKVILRINLEFFLKSEVVSLYFRICSLTWIV